MNSKNQIAVAEQSQTLSRATSIVIVVILAHSILLYRQTYRDSNDSNDKINSFNHNF